MFWRISIFALLQLGCAAAGWRLLGPWGAAGGVAIAAWLAFGWESWRGLRVIRWLREDGAASAGPAPHGLWGEASARMRRRLRQQEQQVVASEQRLHELLAALQASPNGVVLLDAQGHMEWFNQTAAQHFGLDAGRDLRQQVGNLLREPAFSAYLAAQDFAHDVVVPGRDSTPARPVRIAVRLHPYGDGRQLLLSRDITALEQAEAMRRDFVANVSHEIRTPLTVLVGFIETLRTMPLTSEERDHYLKLMAQQADRMQHLVQDLLTLSRLEGSPLPGLDEWTPVQALLRHCEADARALSVLLTPAGAPPHVLRFPADAPQRSRSELAGDAAELHSALSNLVTNAVRYTPPGGRITVQWQTLPDGGARFAVQDTGPGIAAEHLPRLTERFYRIDRSRSRDTGGTGLGLAIVKHVLQRHGATLQIASVPGQGSVFSVDFPASRLRDAALPRPGAASA